MQINVDIGGIVEKFDFEQNEIFVGASSTCDISLGYEGVGDRHLRITFDDSYYEVTDLASGFETFIDGNLLKASSSAIIKEKSEIEVGGVYLTFEFPEKLNKDIFQFETDSQLEIEDDKDDKTQSIDNLLQNLGTQEFISDEKISKIEKDLVSASSEIEDKEQENEFKADLFATHEAPVIKNNDKKPKEIVLKKPSKLVIRKKKLPEKKSKNNFIFFMFIFIGVGAFYFYESYIKDVFKKEQASTTSELKLALTLSPEIKSELKEFEAFVKHKGCSSNDLKIVCDDINQKLSGVNSLKIVSRGDTLIIGIESKESVGLTDSLLQPLEIPKEQLEQIVQAEYQDYFSYENFASNGNLPTALNFTYVRNENKDLFFFLGLLFKEKIEIPEKFSQVFIFVYSDYLGEIVPEDYFKISRINYLSELNLKKSILPRLRVAWRYHLTNGFETLVSGLGSTSKIKFNPDLAKESFSLAVKKKIVENLATPKCRNSKFVFACNEVLNSFTGATSDLDKIIFYIDLDKALSTFSSKKFREYQQEDRRYLASALSGKSQAERRAFQRNGYVSKMDTDKYLLEVLMATFYNLDYSNRLLALDGFNSVSIVGVQDKDGAPHIVNAIDSPISILKSVNRDEIMKKYVYLQRSRISIFDNILSKVTLFKEF